METYNKLTVKVVKVHIRTEQTGKPKWKGKKKEVEKVFRRDPQFISWVHKNGFLLSKWGKSTDPFEESPLPFNAPNGRVPARNYSKKQWVSMSSWYFLSSFFVLMYQSLSTPWEKPSIHIFSSLRYHLGNHCDALVHSPQATGRIGIHVYYAFEMWGELEECFCYKHVKSTFPIIL